MIESNIQKEKINSSGRKKISFSQYQTWLRCPYAWKLSYVDKLRKYENTIHSAFGSAIHEAIQMFVKELYTNGIRAADQLDVLYIFNSVFNKLLKGDTEVACRDVDGNYILDDAGNKIMELVSNPIKTTDEEVSSFMEEGNQIITSIISMECRRKYFIPKKYELIGIEIPINIPVLNKLSFIGYLDIVLRDIKTKKIKIIDLKTSTRMWNKYQQNDISKIYQLLFYKAFYSKQYSTLLKNIEVEFIILKRNLLEGVSFPESRIQRVVPASSKNYVDESIESLLKFITECFSDSGEYNTDRTFNKTPHKGKSRYANCKYCDFSCENGGICDRIEQSNKK